MSSKTLEQVADQRYKAEMCGVCAGFIAGVILLGWVVCTLINQPGSW